MSAAGRTPPPAGPLTDADRTGWFRAFLTDRATRKPSPHTLQAYRQDFDAIATLITGAREHIARYLIHGGWWVPDTTGVLGELVRTTGQYRQIPEDRAMEVAMRMAVDATAQIH